MKIFKMHCIKNDQNFGKMKIGENIKIIPPEMYECDECGKSFKFKSQLKNHEKPCQNRLRRQAQKENALKAPKPADKSAGENKMIIGPDIYKCNECEMTFKFRTGLRRTGRPGRGRTAEAWFRTHLLRHENDHKRLRRQAQKQNMKKAPKPADEKKNVSEMHECNVCTKKFKTKAGV